MNKKIILLLLLVLIFTTGFTYEIETGVPVWLEGQTRDAVPSHELDTIKANLRQAMTEIENKGILFKKPHRFRFYASPYKVRGIKGIYSLGSIVIASPEKKVPYHEIGHAVWDDHTDLLRPQYLEMLEEAEPGITSKDTKDIWAWDIREDFAEEFQKMFTGQPKQTNYPDVEGFEEWLIPTIKNQQVTRVEVFDILGDGRYWNLINSGVVIGDTNGNYKLYDPIKRSELATVLVRLENLTEEKQAPFKDIKGKWYEGYVNNIYGKGLIKGYPDNTFRGEQYMTRYELHEVLKRIK